jgi:anti-sigma B factor antagonist
MPSFALKLERRSGDAALVLAVQGELDLYTTPEFQERLVELAEVEEGGFVVDLLESTFVDSSAGRALLRAARRLREHGARLVVVNRDPEIARIFEIMGLDEFLSVVADREDADAALAGDVGHARSAGAR